MTNYRNAKRISRGRVDCEIEHPVHGWVPYTLDPTDTGGTINNDDLLADMDAEGDVAPYVHPTQAELGVASAAEARRVRNKALADTDYMGLADYPAKAGELAYRQALRDVPQQAGFPDRHTWPTKP